MANCLRLAGVASSNVVFRLNCTSASMPLVTFFGVYLTFHKSSGELLIIGDRFRLVSAAFSSPSMALSRVVSQIFVRVFASKWSSACVWKKEELIWFQHDRQFQMSTKISMQIPQIEINWRVMCGMWMLVDVGVCVSRFQWFFQIGNNVRKLGFQLSGLNGLTRINYNNTISNWFDQLLTESFSFVWPIISSRALYLSSHLGSPAILIF